MGALLLSSHALAQSPGEGAPMMGCPMMTQMGPGRMGAMHAMMTVSTVLFGVLLLAAIFALISLGVYLLRRSKQLPTAFTPA